VSKLSLVLLIVLAGVMISQGSGRLAAAAPSGQRDSGSSDTGRETPNDDPTDRYWYDESD
jgi:hypothetical protein